MKNKISKLSLITVLLTISVSSVNAQKSNIIGAGASANLAFTSLSSTRNNGGIGTSIFYSKMISPKLGFGTRMFYTPYKYSDAIYETLSFTNYNGRYFDISIGATYYFLGDYKEKNWGIYSGIGFGYGNDFISHNRSVTGYPNVLIRESENGFSGNLTLGGTYKIGPGRVFLELNLSYIIYGNSEERTDYPSGYPVDASGYYTPNVGLDFSQKGVMGDNLIPCLNLGYQINF